MLDAREHNARRGDLSQLGESCSPRREWRSHQHFGARSRVPLELIFLFHLTEGSLIVHASDSTGTWQRAASYPHPPPASERAPVQANASLPGDARRIPVPLGPPRPGNIAAAHL